MDHHQSVDPISLEDFSGCGDRMGEKMTGIKKSVWGVPFPSHKTDQIEGFYIRLLTKKLRVTVFILHMTAHVRTHLNIDPVFQVLIDSLQTP